MNKIELINQVIQMYFDYYKSEIEVPAKDLMPYFIAAGVFTKDHRNGLPIRKLLRKLDNENSLHLIPYVHAERKTSNTNWFFQRAKGMIVSRSTKVLTEKQVQTKEKKIIYKDKDENYVLDLCDEVLLLQGSRQHKFDFLLGDAGTKLPVDIFYSTLNLVIEYREYQHTNEVKFFDKPDKMTVSGVDRGEQRKLYDQRRRDILPQNGIQLVEINYTDFTYDRKNKIVRDREKDLEVIRAMLDK